MRKSRESTFPRPRLLRRTWMATASATFWHPQNLNWRVFQSFPMVDPTRFVAHVMFSSIFDIFLDTFTVAQAVNALGFGWFQVKLSLFVGLCWMSDSMEMTILSVLGPALHCDWGINRYKQAMVTTVVFLGMMLSSTFWGSLSDKYGRKPVR